MSNCGYFKIHKGKVSCTHPTYGEEYSKYYGSRLRCDMCRRECNGIYPSQLPSADQTGWVYDVIQMIWNRRTTIASLYDSEESNMEIVKTWTEGEKVIIKE